MKILLLQRVLEDYLQHSVLERDELDEINRTLETIDELKRLTPDIDVHDQNCFIVDADDSIEACLDRCYDTYGRLYVASHGDVLRADFVRTAQYANAISTELLQDAFDLIKDLYADNDQFGCHNPDGTFRNA